MEKLNEKTYADNMMILSQIDFRPIYINEEEMFSVMYNGMTSSVCSVEFNNGKIAFNLASPYLETNKSTDDIVSILNSIKNMEQEPVRELTVADLPILSSKEKAQIKPDKDIDTYFKLSEYFASFGIDASNEFWAKKLLSEAENKQPMSGYFENPIDMVTEYNKYAEQNKEEKEISLKLDRLETMPYGIRRLVLNSLQESKDKETNKIK